LPRVARHGDLGPAHREADEAVERKGEGAGHQAAATAGLPVGVPAHDETYKNVVATDPPVSGRKLGVLV
jgi:hypothetical protein